MGGFKEDGADAVSGGIDAAKVGERFGDAGGDLIRVSEVGDDGLCTEFVGEGRKGGFVAPCEDELGPGGSEFPSKGGADASIGSGDEGGFRGGHY